MNLSGSAPIENVEKQERLNAWLFFTGGSAAGTMLMLLSAFGGKSEPDDPSPIVYGLVFGCISGGFSLIYLTEDGASNCGNIRKCWVSLLLAVGVCAAFIPWQIIRSLL